jgi:hypothetical protein
MQDTSLTEVLNKIIELINSLNIPLEDKVELMINISNFLNKDKYKDNIDTLRRK